jgi:3-oxoacyl-[acyl-carrier protein] reductase
MKNKILLLGGSGDIGYAIGEQFKKNGFELIAPTLKELDLSNLNSIENYIKSVDFSNLSTIVHCAGINNPKPFEQNTMLDFTNTMMVNTFGFARICQLLFGELKKNDGGYVLAISSIYGSISRSGRSTYSTSKHALNGLVKTIAIEWGQYNIKVNTLSPGFVDTQLTRKNNSQEKIDELSASTSLGRMANVEEIANVAFFLCSAQNKYITGQDIVVDGGYLAGAYQK